MLVSLYVLHSILIILILFLQNTWIYHQSDSQNNPLQICQSSCLCRHISEKTITKKGSSSEYSWHTFIDLFVYKISHPDTMCKISNSKLGFTLHRKSYYVPTLLNNFLHKFLLHCTYWKKSKNFDFIVSFSFSLSDCFEKQKSCDFSKLTSPQSCYFPCEILNTDSAL